MQSLKRLGSLLSSWRFCQEVLWQETSLKPTWAFWFIWNLVLVVILSGTIFFALKVTSPRLQQEVDLVIPDFQVEIKGGKLTTSLEDPKIFSTESEIVILDTKKVAYTPQILEDYKYGLFVTENDLTLTAQEEEARINLDFRDFEDQIWSKEALFKYWDENDTKYIAWFSLGLAVLFFVLLAGMGLFFCLLGAVVTWGIGLGFKLGDWPFYKNLAAWMHYFVLLSYLQVILALWGISPIISTLLCLGLLGAGLSGVARSQ